MDKFQKEQEAKKSDQGMELKPSQAPALSPDTLSVGQQKTFLTAIQFVVIFGISPYLQEGVGLQTAKRTCFGEVLSLHSEKIDIIEKDLRIVKCIKGLLDCCKIESLGTIIMSRHLGDILAALLQILHGRKGSSGSEQAKDSKSTSQTPSEHWTPAMVVDLAVSNQLPVTAEKSNCESNESKIDENKKSKEPVVSTTNMNQNGCESKEKCQCLSKQDIEYCEEGLKNLLGSISPPLLVRELLVLQGGPRQQPVQKVPVNFYYNLLSN